MLPPKTQRANTHRPWPTLALPDHAPGRCAPECTQPVRRAQGPRPAAMSWEECELGRRVSRAPMQPVRVGDGHGVAAEGAGVGTDRRGASFSLAPGPVGRSTARPGGNVGDAWMGSCSGGCYSCGSCTACPKRSRERIGKASGEPSRSTSEPRANAQPGWPRGCDNPLTSPTEFRGGARAAAQSSAFPKLHGNLMKVWMHWMLRTLCCSSVPIAYAHRLTVIR